MVWQLLNSTRFAAEYILSRDVHGAEIGLVVVKGTFIVHPNGEVSAATQQVPVALSPDYFGEPGCSSLRYEWDFPLSKQTTDILVNGSGYAPGGEPTRRVDVHVRVGPIAKSLRITGDRSWQRIRGGFEITNPQPFVKMPIIYERAFGGGNPGRPNGWDGRNPLGTGFTDSSESVDGMRLPNVEYPNEGVSSWTSRPRVAGLGATYSHWEPRARFAGTYDARWEQERLPLLPLDFDHRFNQCAPEDQQTPAFLRGGEPVELVNLTPGAMLRFQLPKVVLGLQSEIAGRFQRHRAELYTIILEPEVPRIIIVWHSTVRCHNKSRQVRRTLIEEKPWLPLRAAV